MATTYVRSTVRPVASTQSSGSRRSTPSRKLNVLLWALQSLLAIIFVMAGAMKLLTPAELMEAQSPLPLVLLRFVGVCEVAGALGLILPGLLRIRLGLTPLAAAGLVALMIFATVLTPVMVSPDPVLMLIPATVGVLAAFVGYARQRLAPLATRRS